MDDEHNFPINPEDIVKVLLKISMEAQLTNLSGVAHGPDGKYILVEMKVTTHNSFEEAKAAITLNTYEVPCGEQLH